MDKKTKNLLLGLGCLAFVIFAPIFIYFGSTLIACALSESPFDISIVLSVIVTALSGIVLYFFKPIKRWLVLLILPLIIGGAMIYLIRHKFDTWSYRHGYIQQGYYYYDKFGREVFYGTDDEWEMYRFGYYYYR